MGKPSCVNGDGLLMGPSSSGHKLYKSFTNYTGGGVVENYTGKIFDLDSGLWTELGVG